MAQLGDHQSNKLTAEGMVVVELSKALFADDLDETFRVLGRYMDKFELQISADVLDEYELAGRIKQQ